MSATNNNNNSKRKRLIHNEMMAYIRKAENEELDKEMRKEGIDALMIAANKLAYKKKTLHNNQFVAFPSIHKCLATNDIYDEAEQHYFEQEDDFPLKYIAALKNIAILAGGAPNDDDDEMERMNVDIENSDDEELFANCDVEINTTTFFEPPPPPATKSIAVVEEQPPPPTKKSRRIQLIEKEIAVYVKKAEEEELDKEMREEGVNALIIAATQIAYKKKSMDMKTDQFIAFPSITKCLAGTEIYEIAEKYYYDPEDEFPLKYIAALKDLAMKAGGAPTDDDEEMERLNVDIEDDDDPIFDTIFPTDAEPPKSKRQQRIESEIHEYVKIAEKEELGKEMRVEGVKALIIAANKIAYRKKYYDMSNDTFILFPSVTKLLAGCDVYEEAEKYYYEDGDDYPLKYIAALRGAAFAAGGGSNEDDIIESMAGNADSDDDAF